MRRSILAALAAALLIVAPVTAANPHYYTIDVPVAVATVGDAVPVTWTAWRVRGSLSARMDCSNDLVGVGLSQVEQLSDPEPDFFETGITPSWDGTTPLLCHVGLFDLVNNDYGHELASDTFDLVP